MSSLFLFSLQLRRCLQVHSTGFSASFCNITFLLPLSLHDCFNFQCHIGGSILHNISLPFSMLLMEFSCFLVFCLTFEMHLSLFRRERYSIRKLLIMADPSLDFSTYAHTIRKFVTLCVMLTRATCRSMLLWGLEKCKRKRTILQVE